MVIDYKRLNTQKGEPNEKTKSEIEAMQKIELHIWLLFYASTKLFQKGRSPSNHQKKVFDLGKFYYSLTSRYPKQQE